MGRLTTAAIAILLFGACSPEVSPKDPAAGATFTPCPDPTPAAGQVEVKGLILPPGAELVDRKRTGKKLLRVKGFVEMTPVEVYRFYKRLERKEGYRFFLLEHEVFEAEAFFTTGEHRNYVTARTICVGRSSLFVFVAPEDYEATKKRKP